MDEGVFISINDSIRRTAVVANGYTGVALTLEAIQTRAALRTEDIRGRGKEEFSALQKGRQH